MIISRRIGRPIAAVIISTLVACGSGGDDDAHSETALLRGTLVYVVTECRDTPDRGFSDRQLLQIRQGDREPVTLLETLDVRTTSQAFSLCRILSSSRYGSFFEETGAFQRVGMSPDGSRVVFELTDEFSLTGPFLAPEQKGIFSIRSDGTDLRRLGPPSREPLFVAAFGPLLTIGPLPPSFAFSPDGRQVVFTDKGPGPAGDDATQAMVLDLDTGMRTQVTRFQPAMPNPSLPAAIPAVCCPVFLDNETVTLPTAGVNPDGLNPELGFAFFTVKTDGSDLKMVTPIALPGSQVGLSFAITGDRPAASLFAVSGEPVNPGSFGMIAEVFLIDGQNLLQLTDFRRGDTAGGLGSPNPILDPTGRVFFTASADPFGTNPSQGCQLFSIARTGADLRQLTHIAEGDHSTNGCLFGGRPSGCSIELFAQDQATGTLLFYSSCDPFGTNPEGAQIFAMRPDGTGLRQLTTARGLVREVDGGASGEIPSHYHYSQ